MDRWSLCEAENTFIEGVCMPVSGPTNFEFSNCLHNINLISKLQSMLSEIWGRSHQFCIAR